VLTDEQVRRISGGDCTIADIQSALDQLQQSYDTLVDFTSYVIEGVVGSSLHRAATSGPRFPSEDP
jgi:peptidoglycan hydrolase-like protein with peptidoglycan-binding domain